MTTTRLTIWSSIVAAICSTRVSGAASIGEGTMTSETLSPVRPARSTKLTMPTILSLVNHRRTVDAMAQQQVDRLLY